jgi:UPF0755 protein
LRRYESDQRRNRDDLEHRLAALRKSQPKRRRKRRSNVGPLIVGLLLVAAVIGVIYLIYTTALAGSGGDDAAAEGPVKITVEQGDTLSSVADKLDDAGVIESASLFKLEARFGGQSTEIKPGEYTFEAGAGGEEILAKLTEGEAVPTVAVTIPEGLTLQQTAETVGAAEIGVTTEQFAEAAKRTDYEYTFMEDEAVETTEGYLFPKQYEFEEGTGAEAMVDRLLEQYLIETQELDFEGAQERLNLSEHELVTVASLIERESANSEERPVIASVIYNRIRQGMPLQIDATIQYALGEPKEELSLRDLKVDSPYNTYENPGLPPGPIASPSRESIQAALQPADTDYLYYVLDAEGKEHFFTDNYDEFLAAKAAAGR